MISLLQANAGRNHDVDRYFFLDYRFQHGATPDVLVKDALRRRAFQPGSTDYTDQMQQELAEVPTSFAEETIDRWRGRVKRKKATVTKTDAE